MWKWMVPFPDGGPALQVPEGATLLPVLHVTDDSISVWFDVDTEAPVEARHLFIAGTGHPILEPQGSRTEYVATAFSGSFVWHLFETRMVR